VIPASVIVTTLNEAETIVRCLSALADFGEVIVVDSQSRDDTAALAKQSGAQVVPYIWNGAYPKKRQWCLDTLDLAYDWVFFVDADEVVTPELSQEIGRLFASEPQAAGYFVKGRYVMGGKLLRFGLCNNKLCLLDRRRMEFPVIGDLGFPVMGEIEGHYQPVLKAGFEGETVGRLNNSLLHYAYERNWEARHKRYAAWESAMNRAKAWPPDPVPARQNLKRLFRALPGRGFLAFLHSYVWKRGCLDGKAGFLMARSRFRYYRMIAKG